MIFGCKAAQRAVHIPSPTPVFRPDASLLEDETSLSLPSVKKRKKTALLVNDIPLYTPITPLDVNIPSPVLPFGLFLIFSFFIYFQRLILITRRAQARFHSSILSPSGRFKCACQSSCPVSFGIRPPHSPRHLASMRHPLS